MNAVLNEPLIVGEHYGYDLVWEGIQESVFVIFDRWLLFLPRNQVACSFSPLFFRFVGQFSSVLA
jgi:hypothetical protein